MTGSWNTRTRPRVRKTLHLVFANNRCTRTADAAQTLGMNHNLELPRLPEMQLGLSHWITRIQLTTSQAVQTIGKQIKDCLVPLEKNNYLR